jgi:peptide/nickel transport system substrate-binding protein
MNLQYNPDHYGKSSGDEYAMIKEQLEKSGPVQGEPAVHGMGHLQQGQPADEYPLFQFGWFPDFSDADNYLTPFFPEGNFLKNHYNNPTVNDLIKQAAHHSGQDRARNVHQGRPDCLAKDISTLPLLQGAQVMVAGSGCQGRRTRPWIRPSSSVWEVISK